MRPLTSLPAAAAALSMAAALDESQTTGVMSYFTMASAYMSGARPRRIISSVAPASRRVMASWIVAMAKVGSQDFGHLYASVSVSVGFYYSDHFSVADLRLDIFNVEVKIVQIDFDPCRS